MTLVPMTGASNLSTTRQWTGSAEKMAGRTGIAGTRPRQRMGCMEMPFPWLLVRCASLFVRTT